MTDDPRKTILTKLCKSSDNFSPLLNEVHFVGSFVKCLNGEIQFASVGDIDILIDREDMARQFWDFMDGLFEQGLSSVNDVEELPKTVKNWKPCCPNHNLHPTLLTLDCEHSSKEKQLDVIPADPVLPCIPYSDKWWWDGGTNADGTKMVEPFGPSVHRHSLKKEKVYQESFRLAIPKVRESLAIW